MKSIRSPRWGLPEIGLAITIAVLSSIVFEIFFRIFDIKAVYGVVGGFEEAVKILLFILLPNRAFGDIFIFALLEVFVIKVPLFRFANIECIVHDLVFTGSSFLFHISTALFYRDILIRSEKFWMGVLCMLPIPIHALYNSADYFFDDWYWAAIFCISCGLLILAAWKLWRAKVDTERVGQRRVS